MELYLNREKINHVRNVLTTSVTQEETMEMIVPDSLPDILRIVCVDTMALVRSKDADVGRVSVSGVALASVVYMPDGAVGVRRISAEIPFTISVAESEITPTSHVIARVSAVSADASIVNPRKFVLRVDIRAELQCYNDDELLVFSDVELADNSGIELLRESCDVRIPVDVREKSFVISDEMTLPNGSPEIGEILRNHVTLVAEESKVVGNKVIFRGSTNISLLYNSADGAELHSAELVSEFSQIMELDNASEECDFDMTLMLTGMYIEAGVDDGDGRAVSVELHVVAQCVAAEQTSIPFISDAYSTKYSLTQSSEELAFEHKEPSTRVNTMFRGTLEVPDDTSRVIAVTVGVGTVVESAAADGIMTMRAPLYVTCVYVGSEGRVASAVGRFEAEATADTRAGCRYTITAPTVREAYGAPSGSGIDLRISVDFGVTETMIVSISQLSEISYDEEAAIDTSKMPSLMISKAVGGDMLWKLAKKHHSTAELILSANGLEGEDEIVRGQMLIVPKKR